MSKDSASGFVQDEPAQFAVIGDEVSLLPQRLARWSRNATDDHISDFAFGVATNDMDNLRGVHSNSVQPFENWPEQGQTAGLPLFHESFPPGTETSGGILQDAQILSVPAARE